MSGDIRVRQAVAAAYAAFGDFALPYKGDVARFSEAARLLCAVQRQFPNPELKLLDIASGPGILVAAARTLGFSSQGIDKYIFPEKPNAYFSIASFDKLKAIWAANNISIIPLDYADIQVKIPAGSFDVVTCDCFIEHLVESPRRLFDAARGSLKSGGYFLLTTPNFTDVLKRLRFLAGKSCLWDFNDYWRADLFLGHRREFTVDEIRSMCKASGFTVAALYTKNVYPIRSWRKYGVLKMLARCAARLASVVVPDSKEIIYLLAQKQ